MALNTAGLVWPFYYYFLKQPSFPDFHQQKIGIKTGMTIDDFAPRLSFFFAIGMNFYMVSFNFRIYLFIYLFIFGMEGVNSCPFCC